jgi:DNA-binding MarR family transcriptional regulator/GNAT superfamily N-acetyltransferase
MTDALQNVQVAAVREFNRFYTARLGLLRRRHLDGEFSLTEARLLYEIGAAPTVTATSLRTTLGLDRGYMSRLIASLTKRRLIRQQESSTDARERLLTLTALGEKKLSEMNEQSAIEVDGMMASLSAKERETVVSSLTQVREILSHAQRHGVRIERVTRDTRDVHDILAEYYEAVSVVVRDKPGAMQTILDDRRSGVWLAYLGDEVVGCVVLRRLANIAKASECKRLYVKPSARGHRIADKLLDAQEEYARSQGVEWIYLDTHDGLKAAIALYERRGYERCERYNDNPQATLFMRKRIA